MQKHPALLKVLETKISMLLVLQESDPLHPQDERFYKLAKKLIADGHRISHSVMQMLLKEAVFTFPEPI